MIHRTTRKPLRATLILLVAASLALAAAAGAENRLPANRTYLVAVQGLADDPHAAEFGCLVFHRDGRMVVGNDTGEWYIDDRLTVSHHQTSLVFRITDEDDDGQPVEIEGRCWLETLGRANSLSCSGYGAGEGVTVNFAVTGRPLAGETSLEALVRCEAKAEAYN